MIMDKPPAEPSAVRSAPSRVSWRAEAVSTVVCAAALAPGWGLPRAGGAPALAAVSYGAGGWDAARRSARALARRRLDVDLLMLLAAAGSVLVGQWVEGAILLVLFSLGNTLESYAFGRTRRSIESLMRLRP